MTKFKILLSVVLIITVGITASYFVHTETTKKEDNFRVEVYPINQGWGYLIKKGEKKIIDQPYIPCYSENKPFSSSKDAEKIGNYVLQKIKNKAHPSLTKEEIKLNINIDN